MDFNDVRLRYESLRDEIDNAIGSVLSGGRYILGPLLETFEDECRHSRSFVQHACAPEGDWDSRTSQSRRCGPGTWQRCELEPLRFVWRGRRVQFLSHEKPCNLWRWRNSCDLGRHHS